jgi:polyadenylation factor subunit 2
MFGNGVPPPLPGLDPSHPPDFAKLAEMLGKAGLPPPPPIGAGQIPQLPGMLPPGLLPPPGFPGGFPPPPPGMGAPPFQIPGMTGNGAVNENKDSEPPQSGGGSIRRRGPLPSQEESLQMEQRKGKYTRAR